MPQIVFPGGAGPAALRSQSVVERGLTHKSVTPGREHPKNEEIQDSGWEMPSKGCGFAVPSAPSTRERGP